VSDSLVDGFSKWYWNVGDDKGKILVDDAVGFLKKRLWSRIASPEDIASILADPSHSEFCPTISGALLQDNADNCYSC
jgi:hypothetical protein